MAIFAIINIDNTVENIVMGDSKENMESLYGKLAVEVTSENPANPKVKYDPVSGMFEPPVYPEALEIPPGQTFE